ncbi:MAG: hypothetical protein Q9219_005739 [cf. Caloplaca sp. 3 TL-2023]
MTVSNTTVLITGARRGLGRGLVQGFLLRPSTTVIAAVRDPADPVSASLQTLPSSSGSNLILVPIDASSETDAQNAVESLQSKHGITKIDIVISNSGVAKHIGVALDTPPKELKDHFEINTVSHLLLFQATWPLLTTTTSEPKFIIISSSVGSIGAMEKEPVPMLAYGSSKAATNFLVRKLHFEHEKLICFTIHPGWVGTQMGWYAAKAYGVEQPSETTAPEPSAIKPLTVEESANALLKQVREYLFFLPYEREPEQKSVTDSVIYAD